MSVKVEVSRSNYYHCGMAKRTPVPAVKPKDWARFMSKVEVQPNGCWHWIGAVWKNGYGQFSVGNRCRRAHRVIFVWTHGEIGEDQNLDHQCHSDSTDCPGGSDCLHRRCVNPDHLRPKTQAANLAGAVHVKADHCKYDHPRDAENCVVDKRGQRRCRACAREQSRARRIRLKPDLKPRRRAANVRG